MSQLLQRFNFHTSNVRLPASFLIIAIIFWVFDSALSPLFIYNKAAIEHGELWRLLSGHLLHTNVIHLLLNISAIALLWLLHDKHYKKHIYITLFIWCALFTSAGIYYLSSLDYYVGLSGVLHGVFVWGACKDIESKDKSGYLLFLGVWLKVAHEQYYGASADIAKLIEANVAIDAHLYGALGGLLFFGLLKVKSTLR